MILTYNNNSLSVSNLAVSVYQKNAKSLIFRVNVTQLT